MGTTTPLEKQLADADLTGDHNTLWAAYKAFWDAGKDRDIAPGHAVVFKTPEIANEAIVMARSDDSAGRAVRGAASALFSLLDDSDAARVFLEILPEADRAVALWQTDRVRAPLPSRIVMARGLTKMIVERDGRERARSWALAAWYGIQEEEKEAILATLLSGGALTEGFLLSLGPEAVALARRHLDPWRLGQILADAPTTLRFRSAAKPATVERLSELLAAVRVSLDVRDSGLTAAETVRLAAFGGVAGHLGSNQFLERTARRLRHWSPESEQIADLLIGLAGTVSWAGPTPDAIFSVPLLRLLHTRMILEAPALAPALERPEQHLVPEALLYVLGRDAVSYSPELRLLDGGERRWRARWAESTGEAFSALVLEAAINLDITTLARIPETNEETPDFRATTQTGEPVVFESKGGTSWRIHLSQRAKALSQLGKNTGKVRRRQRSSWRGQGRAMASCLFAATLGAERSSLMYLADPPFGFGSLFPEGWQQQARRQHYIAVSEAGGLFGLADRLQQGGPIERLRDEIPHEGERFSFGGTEGLGGATFVGRYVSLEVEARRLRHPRSSELTGVRLFTGIASSLYDRLARGELPADPLRPDPNVQETYIPASSTGMLPGPEKQSRGIFSQLSDGAFLAFEVGGSPR